MQDPNQPRYNPQSYQYNQFNQFEDTRPLTVEQWLGTILLTAIPVVNIVLLLIWAFDGNTNINKRNYAKAQLIVVLIGIGLSILFFIAFIAMSAVFLSNFRY